MTAATYSELRGKRIRLRLITFLVLTFIVIICSVAIEAGFSEFKAQNIRILRYLSGFLRPDWKSMPTMVVASLETVFLALIGTFIGTILSIVISLYAANNLNPLWVSTINRFFISLERSTSHIIILLLLLVVLGPGLAAGIFTIAISCIGMLGKLYADAIEDIPNTQLDALRAQGIGRWPLIKYGVFPHLLLPAFSFAILRFEINLRASVLLGAAGAGGIGYKLMESYYRLDYPKMSMAVLTILVLVMCSEWLSNWGRKKIMSRTAKAT